MTAPDQSRVYFPVRRIPRTPPPVGAPTLADAIWAICQTPSPQPTP